MRISKYMKPVWCFGALVLCGSNATVPAQPVVVTQLVPPAAPFIPADVCVKLEDQSEWTCR